MKFIAAGTHDFKKIIETNSLYIDKTLFVKELIDDTSDVICFPRPRRFGKTLNMSMLDYYFNIEYKDNPNIKDLFKGLNISKEEDRYLREMNKYPVISLSFRGLKTNTYQEFIDEYKKIIYKLYLKFNYLLTSDKVSEPNKKIFEDYYNMKTNNLSSAISDLMLMLKEHYNKEVIVLLDEYDAPILNGYLKGYYDEIITFIKQIFVTTFKDNNDLKKGIITGISRISKENMFSDANNIIVYNMTDNMYSNYFGFTESEVKEVLKEYNLENTFQDVKKWYDGYLFNKTTIYNPWSILNYLKYKELKPYWVKTGGVDLLKNLIYNLNNKLEILNSFEKLLETGTIEHINLDVNLDLSNLEGDKDNIYTLFMLSGYLTPMEYVGNLKDVTLRIPNLEIKENLENIVIDWFKTGPLRNYDFTRFLISHDLENFKSSFKNIVEESFSYYDVPNNHDGENFYHAFTLGLLRSSQSNFEITSNRESGYGRYDLMLKPINSKYAYIIEFKLLRDNDFDKTIEDGFKQIEDNHYDVTLKDYDVTKMVIAFKGKKVKIETRN